MLQAVVARAAGATAWPRVPSCGGSAADNSDGSRSCVAGVADADADAATPVGGPEAPAARATENFGQSSGGARGCWKREQCEHGGGVCTTRRFHRRMAGSAHWVSTLQLTAALTGHTGCVNTVNWSECGRFIVSGSDDTFIRVWDPWTKQCAHAFASGHTGNLFCTRFLPQSLNRIVSTAADGQVRYTRLKPDGTAVIQGFRWHQGLVHEIGVDPFSPDVILSASQDGTVRLFDVRADDEDAQIVVDLRGAGPDGHRVGILSMAVNPVDPNHFVTVGKEPYVRLFDRRAGFSQVGMACPRIWRDSTQSIKGNATGVAYSTDGEHIVASYVGRPAALFRSHGLLQPWRSLATVPSEDGNARSDENDDDEDEEDSSEEPAGASADGAPVASRPTRAPPTRAEAALSIAEVIRRRLAERRARANEIAQPVPVPTTERPRTVLESIRSTLGLPTRRPRTTTPTEDSSDADHDDDSKDDTKAEDEDNDDDEEDAQVERPDADGHKVGLFQWKMHWDSVGQQRVGSGRLPWIEPTRFDGAAESQSYSGHCNMRTVKEIGFMGPNSEFVVSGSDCGHIFVYDTASGRLLRVMRGDSRIVNVVQSHPSEMMLVTAGIDDDIKVWQPTRGDAIRVSSSTGFDAPRTPSGFVVPTTAWAGLRERNTEENTPALDQATLIQLLLMRRLLAARGLH